MNTTKTQLLLDLNITENNFEFAAFVASALNQAELELQSIDETTDSIKVLRPECDKLDYILAASSGALCGIIDIFLVGKPGESPIGDITDKWFADRTKDFSKLCGWKDNGDGSLSSAIKHLEKKFKIPYDQSSSGGAAKDIFNLTPSNHHFKSLAHNPSLFGLFFSILDQFDNTSHFVTGGQLVSLQDADGRFELRGNNTPSKLFCGFVNWLGHIISDRSGSHTSKGRGMGVASPLWTWTNDIIAIKSKLNIPVSQFDNDVNELALNIFEKGYDARFQTAQAIPVFINELIVRLIYSIRRLVKYISKTDKDNRNFKSLWSACEPFSNPTVKRMLTVAHGTFCLIDIGDATIRGFVAGGGNFNAAEFFMRLNIVGIGRFTISLYGEVRREIDSRKAEEEIRFLQRERVVVEYYIEGLKILADRYDDQELLNFVDDLKSSNAYIQGFEKSVELARKRNIPTADFVSNKSEIDNYFMGDNKNG
ncbi:MAG: hypothetical protein IIW72_06395 [Clostridia bacterium]|nr:hypothetical protein [Clostridia bacterium]